jgi:PBSX family phage terminase large subunit
MAISTAETTEVRTIAPESREQHQAMLDKSLSLLFDGPWGSGKTHLGAAKALAVGWDIPNNCIALVRRKRVDLKPTLWKWFIDKILPPEMVVQHNDTELYRRIINGTEFYGVGLDSALDVNKLASREYGLIIVEEAREISEDDFDGKILRNLRLPNVPFHQALLLTNPDSPAHWIYKRFYLKRQDGYNAIKGRTLRHLLPESYMQRLDQLTGIFRKRYRDGEWVAAEGMVYPFDPMKHIVKSFPIPYDWQRVIAVDFGFDHPFVCQWYGVSPSDVWYMYREIYYSNRTVRNHAKDITAYMQRDIEDALRDVELDLQEGRIDKRRYEDKRAEIEYNMRPSIICDHDAEDIATLNENGLRTRPAEKDRLAGQQAVYTKFENEQLYLFEDALVEVDQRLLMEGKPTRTADEYGTYVWMSKGKEDMVKVKDDGMDTQRYAIYTTGGVGAGIYDFFSVG